MAIRMTNLRRAPNGDWFSRKLIPEDVREAYKAAFRVSQEARFRSPAGTREGQAKQEFRDWDAEIASVSSGCGQRPEGKGCRHSPIDKPTPSPGNGGFGLLGSMRRSLGAKSNGT
jgi:hypothetical protein